MLLVLQERSALPAVSLDTLDPVIAGLGNRDALARGCVHSSLDINLDLGVILVGVLLALECLNVTVALLINVIDYP
jgi:hypothetical protein